MSMTPPPTVPYRRFESGGIRRWIKRNSSTENLLHAAKTLAWVGPLTILIWIYADREQQIPLKDVPVTLEFRSNVANAIVEVREPAVPNVVLELFGPRGGVERVSKQLYSATGTATLAILLDSSRVPGREYTLEVLRQLNNNDLLKNNGVSVTSAKPAQITVYIDETISRTLAVGKPPQMTNLVGTPEFDPPTVKVEGPRLLIDALPADAVAIADLAPLNLSPGNHTIPSVRILPLSPGLVVKPGTVQATVLVRDNDVTFTVPSIPIWEQVPYGFRDRYELQYKNSVPNVKVIGPPEQIDLIEKGGFKPLATLRVSDDDIGAIDKPLPLTLNLPPGVRLVRDGDAALLTVNVTVTRKTATP